MQDCTYITSYKTLFDFLDYLLKMILLKPKTKLPLEIKPLLFFNSCVVLTLSQVLGTGYF